MNWLDRRRLVALLPSADGVALWEIRLAPLDAETPPGARRVFAPSRSPYRTLASFLLVRTRPAARTSVHAHPGPELI